MERFAELAQKSLIYACLGIVICIKALHDLRDPAMHLYDVNNSA